MTLYHDPYNHDTLPGEPVTMPYHRPDSTWVTDPKDVVWDYLTNSLIRGSIIWIATTSGKIVCGKVICMGRKGSNVNGELYVEICQVDGYYGGTFQVDAIAKVGLVLSREDHEKIKQGMSANEGSTD